MRQETDTSGASLTPEEIERQKDAEARRKWVLNESGVAPYPGGDSG